MKTKPILSPFGRPFVTIRFDEKTIFKTLLGLTPYCDYKLTNAIHADSASLYTNEKITILSTIDEIYLKYNCNNGSFVNGIRELFVKFCAKKPPGYKVYCELETKHYIKNTQICFEYSNFS